MSARPGPVRRWRVGFPPADVGEHDAGIAFDVSQLGGPATIGFHEAMASPVPARAPEVEIRLPGYRGKALVRLLNWLVVHRLVEPGGSAAVLLDKQQGPGSMATLLTGLGWRDVGRTREGRLHRVAGVPPQDAELPDTPRFAVEIGGRELEFAADYGVFAPGRIDDGTRLLAEVALAEAPVAAVADVGVGYGPLAVALVRAGVATRAVATDVDCVALYLAESNARSNGVSMTLECTADPARVEDTPLTVCNVPTHLDAGRTATLMAGLLHRARRGRTLLVVVHGALEARYRRYFAEAGIDVAAHPGAAHVVLAARG